MHDQSVGTLRCSLHRTRGCCCCLGPKFPRLGHQGFNCSLLLWRQGLVEESSHSWARGHLSHKLFKSIVGIHFVENRDKVNVFLEGPVEAKVRVVIIVKAVVIIVMIRALAFEIFEVLVVLIQALGIRVRSGYQFVLAIRERLLNDNKLTRQWMARLILIFCRLFIVTIIKLSILNLFFPFTFFGNGLDTIFSLVSIDHTF